MQSDGGHTRMTAHYPRMPPAHTASAVVVSMRGGGGAHEAANKYILGGGRTNERVIHAAHEAYE